MSQHEKHQVQLYHKEKKSMQDVIQFPFECILMLVCPSRALLLRQGPKFPIFFQTLPTWFSCSYTEVKCHMPCPGNILPSPQLLFQKDTGLLHVFCHLCKSYTDVSEYSGHLKQPQTFILRQLNPSPTVDEINPTESELQLVPQ